MTKLKDHPTGPSVMRWARRVSASYESSWSCMSPLPSFEQDTGCPPPGRYAMTWDEVEATLVLADEFEGTTTRRALWEELTFHRAQVECLAGSVSRIWLAGSFVSTKPDPSDIDVTYLLEAAVYGAISQQDDLADLANLEDREWCVRNGMRIDAYVLSLPATKDFRDLGLTGAMATEDAEVFQRLGLYDEIWQRCRVGDGRRRGYVEVSL
ncbi:DUF6932 family protein [Streptomyces nanhaiensis]|uniref:DUF6932 family protein n=1 Tax=Streptomyces nanhaiensis TaxID=679319 RepID=UPI00399CBA05